MSQTADDQGNCLALMGAVALRRTMDPRCSWKRRVRAMRRAERVLPAIETVMRNRVDA